MKRLILAVMAAGMALAGLAQSVDDALYVYRNDGGFNAFFREEVDSITFSNYDAAGKRHDQIVSQVVHTPDSSYAIPLSVIDSISFVKPQVVFQPDVDQLGSDALAYLQSADGLTLTFSTAMPQELRPKQGHVLISTEPENELLSGGFVGRATSVAEQNGVLRVVCDSVESFTEIFQRFVGIERIGQTASANARRVLGNDKTGEHEVELELELSGEVSENVEASLSGGIKGKWSATVAYLFDFFTQALDMRIHHEWSKSIGLGFKVGESYEWPNDDSKWQEKTLFMLPFPAVAPVFKLAVTGTPFFKVEGNAELSYEYNSPTRPFVTNIVYSDAQGFKGCATTALPPKADGSDPESFETEVSLNGTLMAGGKLGFSVGTIDVLGCMLAAKAEVAIGPKLEADFKVKASTAERANLYTLFKDTKLEMGLMADVEIYGEAKFLGKKLPKATVYEESFPTPLSWEWYLMPAFSDLAVATGSLSATISTTPSRNLLAPVSLGIALTDDTWKFYGLDIDSKYEDDSYRTEGTGYVVSQKFTSLTEDHTYYASPLISLWGMEFKGLPEKEFKIESQPVVFCPDEDHPHAIDLGLPSGNKWMCCNAGTTEPKAAGGYYDWATAQQQGKVPSREDFEELLDNCSLQHDTQYENYWLVGPNGNAIYMPFAGRTVNQAPPALVGAGFYWTSTPSEYWDGYYYNVYFNGNKASIEDSMHTWEYSVRTLAE